MASRVTEPATGPATEPSAGPDTGRSTGPDAGTSAEPSTVTVRFFAGARQAAGVAEERIATDELADLGALVDALSARSNALARVLTACSFLVNGVAARDRSIRVPAGGTVDVLPPFAGG